MCLDTSWIALVKRPTGRLTLRALANRLMSLFFLAAWGGIIPVAGGTRCFAQAAPAPLNDSLEIRSGPTLKASPLNDSIDTEQKASNTDTTHPVVRKRTREEILRIPLEELLELPMETVLEYAKVIDSIKAAQQASRMTTPSRTSSKKRGSSGVSSSGSSLPTPSHAASKQTHDTQTLDKLNLALQHLQEQRQQQGTKTGRSSTPTREELLRMKLKDLMDMRLGEILKLVNPVLASTATSSGSRRK